MRLFSVENLSILVRGKPILENVSFEIEQGDIFCILGKNGSGKSTILKSILGLYPRLGGGSIRLANFNLQQTPRKIYLPLIGALIENASLYPHLTALENLKVVASYYPNVKRTRIDEVLGIVGLEKEANKLVAQFSQGMKQRLGIAIAILHKPQLILLDEPTNTLDPEAITQLRNLILTLHKSQNCTFILNTHHLEEATRLATKIIILKEGKVVYRSWEAENWKLLEEINLPSVFKEKILGSFLKSEKKYFLIETPDDSCNIAYKKPDLEEIFLALHHSVL